MKKILLGIEGIIPREESLLYTLDLAKNLHAKVEIFEVIPSIIPFYPNRKRKWTWAMEALKGFIEGSVLAAIFAESSQQDIAQQVWRDALENLAPFKEKIGKMKPFPELIIKKGNLVGEMVKHIQTHKEIIMAVLSHRELHGKRGEKLFNTLRNQVDVPLILVKDNV